MPQEQASPRKTLRAAGIKRRKQILEATLRVILKDGIRGVRHRAVAEEAKVPLASTTYYFKDIEELLTDTFLFWNHGASIYTDQFQSAVSERLQVFSRRNLLDASLREELVNTIARLVADYVMNVIIQHRDDSIIELAFHHEAARNGKLRTLVADSLSNQIEVLELFYRMLGSANVTVDAHITLSLLLRLQKMAIMSEHGYDRGVIEKTIHRHFHTMLLAVSHETVVTQ